jgi:hypothetical protein
MAETLLLYGRRKEMRKVCFFGVAIVFAVYMMGTEVAALSDCGPVLDLNGVDQCVTSPVDNDVNLAKDFTVQAWVRPSADFDWGVFIAVREMWFSINGDGHLEFSGWYAHGAQAEFWVSDTVDVPKDQWSHVTIVEDSALNVNFYINGVLTSTVVAPDENWFDLGNAEGYHTEGWAVGARPYPLPDGPMYFFKGRITEARMWGRALSADEVANQYLTQLNGDEIGLVRYYRLDEGTGTVVNDYSTYNVDGEVQNPPAWAEDCFPWFTGPTPTPHCPCTTGVDEWLAFE